MRFVSSFIQRSTDDTSNAFFEHISKNELLQIADNTTSRHLSLRYLYADTEKTPPGGTP